MNKIKKTVYRFSPVFAAVLLLAGCTQLFQNGNDTQTASGGYSTVKLVLAPAERTASSSSVAASAVDNAARSAYPSAPDSSMLYKVTAQESGASSSIDCTVSKSGSELSVSLFSGKTWTVTVTAYASSDTAYATPLLTGSAKVTLSANQTTAASATVALLPADGATGTGTISLKMTDGTADKTINSITAEYTVAGTTYTTALTGSSSSGWTFSHGTDGTASGASIAAGTYNVVFYFYNSDNSLIGFYPDEIAVYPGLTTDKWYVNGSSGSDTLSITDDMMHTEVINVGNSYIVSSSRGNDSNSGTFSKPFATLTKALSAVNSANDGTSSYTIYVEGTLTETEQTVDGSAAGYCEQIAPGKNLTLSIIGGAAVLDASAVSSSTNSVDLLSVTGGSNNYTVNLTLNGLTLKCPSGTSASFPGCGVHTTSSFGTGSSLTLQGCTITTDSANTYPVYNDAADGSDLALTLSGSTAIAASDTGNAALSTAGSVTIASSDISVTGILTAGSIVVNAVPSSPITVKPYSSPTGSAVTLFSSDSTQAVSGCISSFPLWDTTDYYYTDSFTVMSVQTLTTEYEAINGGYNGCTVNITTKGGQISVPVTDLTGTYLATTIGSNGEIYVVYYDPSGGSGCYCVFYAGVAGAFIISGLSGTPTHLALCQVSDGLLLSTGPGILYKLTSTTTNGTTTWAGTAVTDGSLSNTTFTSLTSVNKDGTQYVFYTYTDKTSTPYIPRLGCAVLTGTTLTKEWDNDAAVSLKMGDANDVYSSSVSITDMTVALDGKLYMLLSDTSDKTDFLLNSDLYLTSRGALICAGSAQSLASDTSPSSLSLTPYGWRAGANGTTPCTAYGYESSVISIYASSSASYEDDQYFAGSGRFLCLTPKQITMADSGIYVADGTSWTTKYGTAVFTLDGSVLDLSIATSESESVSLYGVFGSGSITTSSSSY